MDCSSLIVKGKITARELRMLRSVNDFYEDRFSNAEVTGTDKSYRPDIRKSQIYFPKVENSPQIFNILQSIVLSDYQNKLECDLQNIAEIQYATYNEGDFFKRHRDTIANRNFVRVITMSLNLSNSKDYTGGELVVYENGNEHTLDREAGSYIIFPAYMRHEAKIVKSGTRQAVVVWIQDEEEVVKKINQQLKSMVD